MVIQEKKIHLRTLFPNICYSTLSFNALAVAVLMLDMFLGNAFTGELSYVCTNKFQ